jgi:competence protein ComEC
MARRPLVICALLFSSGIFAASEIRIPFWPFYIAGLAFFCFCLFSLRKARTFDIFFSCLVFFLAASLLKNTQALPKNHLARFISYKNPQPYTLRGYVDSPPLFKNRRTSFVFQAEELQCSDFKYKTCGNILVQLKGKPGLNYGAGLILKGNLYRPFSLNNRKRQSYRDYLAHQDIFALMNIKASGAIARLNENKGNALKRFAFGLKERIESIISRRLSPVPASILEAMVLGEKRNIPPVIYNSMIKSGTVHILVVSGFNVGIVAFIIVLCLKLMRIPRKMRFYLATPLLVL